MGENKRCMHCNGTGKQICYNCGGVGSKMQTRMVYIYAIPTRVTCYSCHGTGKKDCPYCHGTGKKLNKTY